MPDTPFQTKPAVFFPLLDALFVRPADLPWSELPQGGSKAQRRPLFWGCPWGGGALWHLPAEGEWLLD